MDKKVVSPRLLEPTRKWYSENFSSIQSGTQFILESFPELYKRALLEIKGHFIREELLLIVDVYNSTMLTPGLPMLEAQVSDGIALDGLDQKWNIDKLKMLPKIGELTSFQAAILEIWANSYWYAQPKKKLRDLEEYVKVLID